MRTVELGSTGQRVSAIGLGANNFGWRLSGSESSEVIDAAADLGIDFIDTADIYSEGESERVIGRALAGRRDRFFIATKVGMPWEDGSRPGGLRPDYVRESVVGSLERLDTSWIDLLQIHLPDPTTPLEDTLAAMAGIVDEGLVRFIGCSNVMAWEVAEWILRAEAAGWPRLQSVQIEYSMLVRDVETELLEACHHFGVSLIPHRPLAQGFLTGKYRRGGPLPEGSRLTLQESARRRRFTDRNFEALDAIIEAAEAVDATPAQVAIAWLLSRERVGPVIAGASNVGQLTENARAADVELAPETIEELDEILPEPTPGAVGTLPLRASIRRP